MQGSRLVGLYNYGGFIDLPRDGRYKEEGKSSARPFSKSTMECINGVTRRGTGLLLCYHNPGRVGVQQNNSKGDIGTSECSPKTDVPDIFNAILSMDSNLGSQDGPGPVYLVKCQSKQSPIATISLVACNALDGQESSLLALRCQHLE